MSENYMNTAKPNHYTTPKRPPPRPGVSEQNNTVSSVSYGGSSSAYSEPGAGNNLSFVHPSSGSLPGFCPKMKRRHCLVFAFATVAILTAWIIILTIRYSIDVEPSHERIEVEMHDMETGMHVMEQKIEDDLNEQIKDSKSDFNSKLAKLDNKLDGKLKETEDKVLKTRKMVNTLDENMKKMDGNMRKEKYILSDGNSNSGFLKYFDEQKETYKYVCVQDGSGTAARMARLGCRSVGMSIKLCATEARQFSVKALPATSEASTYSCPNKATSLDGCTVDTVTTCRKGIFVNCQHNPIPLPKLKFPTEIRLSQTIRGRVEVKFCGQWGAICSNNLNNNELTNLGQTICTQTTMAPLINIQQAGWSSPSTPVWIHNIHCDGIKSDISECDYEGIDAGICDDSTNNYLWVTCTNKH